MTLAELLTECQQAKTGKPVRVFTGCMTLFNGNPAVMSKGDWVKLHTYFNCKVLNKREINGIFVITV